MRDILPEGKRRNRGARERRVHKGDHDGKHRISEDKRRYLEATGQRLRDVLREDDRLPAAAGGALIPNHWALDTTRLDAKAKLDTAMGRARVVYQRRQKGKPAKYKPEEGVYDPPWH